MGECQDGSNLFAFSTYMGMFWVLVVPCMISTLFMSFYFFIFFTVGTKVKGQPEWMGRFPHEIQGSKSCNGGGWSQSHVETSNMG